EPEVPAAGDTKAATKENAAKENPVKSVEKTDTIEDEQVPTTVEDEVVAEDSIEDSIEDTNVDDESLMADESIEKSNTTEEETESSTNTVLVTLFSLILLALIGAGIYLWRRK
ncbi:hypothetical protein, partial [Pseudobutyrivibrio sp.]|uniref:hypothetical protein n=1 Tax=Pseudobutyrivibrio sp. TaxID=2014367 RepID=UPI001B76E537